MCRTPFSGSAVRVATAATIFNREVAIAPPRLVRFRLAAAALLNHRLTWICLAQNCEPWPPGGKLTEIKADRIMNSNV
jgi:hypothetical protein